MINKKSYNSKKLKRPNRFGRIILISISGVTLTSILFTTSTLSRQTPFFKFDDLSGNVAEDKLDAKYVLLELVGGVDCPRDTSISSVEECIQAGASLGLRIGSSSDKESKSLTLEKSKQTPRGCYSRDSKVYFSTYNHSTEEDHKDRDSFGKDHAHVCKDDGAMTNFTETNLNGTVNPAVIVNNNDEIGDNKDASKTNEETNEVHNEGQTEGISSGDPHEFFSFHQNEAQSNVKFMDNDINVDVSKYQEYQYPQDPSREDDKDCIFLDSPMYRSIFVYPNWKNETDGWDGPILSGQSNVTKWPWLDIDKRGREGRWGHYGPANNQMGQYTLELIVRELMTHPESCLRTMNPMNASLFYVPYLPSTEFHDGKTFAADYSTSPYGTAIGNAIEGKYQEWEELFGLTSDFWKRKNGADHILVFSEPLHGLSHPRNKRGSYHFINTQMMLTPPIILSVEVSKSFVDMYPKCAAKNIVTPYPNPDGNWFNGNFDKQSFGEWKHFLEAEAYLKTENETLSISKQSFDGNGTIDIFQPRPLAQYFSAGKHGTCKHLRVNMGVDYNCSPSSRAFKGKIPYHHGMRLATFCPCPGGDSPSAKRMFDTINAGCIPVILSHDFVWPYTSEADPSITIDPSRFSLRWNKADFEVSKYGDQCILKDDATPTIEQRFEMISVDEIANLRESMKKMSWLYSFWDKKGYPQASEFPLIDGVFPGGGASIAIVKLLGDRAGGSRWPECKIELDGRVEGKDATRFVC
jgi:hypothetical protein